MCLVINEILQEIKNKCDEDTYDYLNNFITQKMYGYKISKIENNIIKYNNNKNEQWLKMFFVTKKLQGLSDKTLKYYDSEIRKFVYSINKNLDEVTSDDVKYYLACIQLKGKTKEITLDNTRRCLSTFFQFLEDEEYISKSPVKKIKKIKSKKQEKNPFTNDEIAYMRLNIDKIKNTMKKLRFSALFEFLLSTGCRISEVVNLKIDDINFYTNDVKVLGKGNKERIVYLNSNAKFALKKYLSFRKDSSPYMFVNLFNSKKILIDQFEREIREFGREINIIAHPHKFRRTCACILLERGMPLQEVSKYLGHENLSTTQIYINVQEKDIKNSHLKYMN